MEVEILSKHLDLVEFYECCSRDKRKALRVENISSLGEFFCGTVLVMK